MKKPFIETIYTNRKAFHNYEILERFEAGIVLEGAEVKSLRQKQVSLSQSFARAQNGEIYIYGMYIAPYAFNAIKEIDPYRTRKLLLKKREIKKLETLSRKKGMSIVPIEIYLKKGWVKLTIAAARGKKIIDKHEKLKKRDIDREVRREFKEKYKG